MGVGLSGISAHATGRPGTGGQGVEGCIWRASSVSIWHTEAARPWSSSASQSEGCWGHGSRDASCPFANLRPAHVRGSPRSLRRLGDECSLGVLRLKVLRVAYKWKDPSRRRCEYETHPETRSSPRPPTVWPHRATPPTRPHWKDNLRATGESSPVAVNRGVRSCVREAPGAFLPARNTTG